MGTMQPTLTYSEALRKFTPPRHRTLSKRARSESSDRAMDTRANICPEDKPNHGVYVGRAFEHWTLVTNVMEKADLVFNKDHPNHDLFNSVKTILNSAASLQFDMAEKLDCLVQRGDIQDSLIDKHSKVIDRNCAGGNIVTSVEKSSAYEQSCLDLKESGKQCKILDLDLGKKITDPAEISKRAREILREKDDIKMILKDVQIVSLGKTTVLKDDKHSAPLLIKLKSKDNKDAMEKALRKSGFSTAFHWPKNLIKSITCMRNQLSTFKNTNIDLNGKQIMIRPAYETGKKINIHYRDVGEKKWTFLEAVKTPVHDSLLSEFKGEQICKSDYFVL